MHDVAKIFTNGGSQAVRLPARYRFSGQEVLIRKNPKTGEVILSPKPRQEWDKLLKMIAETSLPPDFLTPEDRQYPNADRDPFAWMSAPPRPAKASLGKRKSAANRLTSQSQQP